MDSCDRRGLTSIIIHLVIVMTWDIPGIFALGCGRMKTRIALQGHQSAFAGNSLACGMTAGDVLSCNGAERRGMQLKVLTMLCRRRRAPTAGRGSRARSCGRWPSASSAAWRTARSARAPSCGRTTAWSCCSASCRSRWECAQVQTISRHHLTWDAQIWSKESAQVWQGAALARLVA